MIAFIDNHHHADRGVEPICRVLPIAPASIKPMPARRSG